MEEGETRALRKRNKDVCYSERSLQLSAKKRKELSPPRSSSKRKKGKHSGKQQKLDLTPAAKRGKARKVSIEDKEETSLPAFRVIAGPPPICWTEKYRPGSSTDANFVGNPEGVKAAQQWLSEWRHGWKYPDGNTDCPSSDSEASRGSTRPTTSCLLISGPPGVGKTSLVYHIASCVGYRVFEINVSSDRPGRKMVADLREAIQSQHMRKTCTDFFGGISASTAPADKPKTSTLESRMEERVAEIKAKTTEKKKQAPTKGTLFQFFKPSSKSSEIKPPIEEEVVEIQDTSAEEVCLMSAAIDTDTDIQKDNTVIEVDSPERNQTSISDKMEYKCSDQALTLFDDVDIIFDKQQDDGFWSAMPQIVQLSRRPVVFTCTNVEAVINSLASTNCQLVHVQLRRPHTSELVEHLEYILRGSQPENGIEIRTENDTGKENDSGDLVQNAKDCTPGEEVAHVMNGHISDPNTSTEDHLKVLDLPSKIDEESINKIKFLCDYFANDVRRLLVELEFKTRLTGFCEPDPRSHDWEQYLKPTNVTVLSELSKSYRQFGLDPIYSLITGSLSVSCRVRTVSPSIERQEQILSERSMSLDSDSSELNKSTAEQTLTESEISDDYFDKKQNETKDVDLPKKGIDLSNKGIPWTRPTACDSICLEAMCEFFETESACNAFEGHVTTPRLPSERRFDDLMLRIPDLESEVSPIVEDVCFFVRSTAAVRLVSKVKTCVHSNNDNDRWCENFTISDRDLLRRNNDIKDQRRSHKINESIRSSGCLRAFAAIDDHVTLDGCAAVRAICGEERMRKRETGLGRGRRQRFLHYLNNLSIFIDPKAQESICQFWSKKLKL